MDNPFRTIFRRFFGSHRADPAVAQLQAMEANRVAAAAALPFERVETTGRDALATWDRLLGAGRGWPIVVGGDNDLAILAEGWAFDDRTPDAILAAANEIAMPAGLIKLRTDERDEALAWLAREGSGGSRPDEPMSPEELEGEWPDEAPAPTALTVASDSKGTPLAKLHILLIPTERAADVPAYLRWGGANGCPAPEYHVAALRSWEERFGAELVGMSYDVLNLRVARRPKTRDEAVALAHEHFVYCEDIVHQGVGALRPAASLLAHHWWYFWWD